MAVSIGGGFTGKPRHELSLVFFFAASYEFPLFLVKIFFVVVCIYSEN